MLGAVGRHIRRLAREERGVVLILFLLVFLPALTLVAVAIDFSQTLVVKRQLTSAVDSAALSLGTLPSVTDDDELRAKAEAYIKAHYPDRGIGELTTFTAVRDGEIINVSATARVPTNFLGITGRDSWSLTVHSSVLRRETKLEVVMVLDNSGSMNGRRMDAMKSAANTLVDILFGADEVSDSVKIGLVPFSSAVNVNVPATTPWLDVATPNPMNWEIISDLETAADRSVMSLFGGLGERWKGCVRARRGGHDVLDTAPDPIDRDTLFTPYFAPDEGGTPGGNNYVLLDGVLPVTNIRKYLAPGRRLSLNSNNTPNYNCGEPIQPLTNEKSAISSRIDGMEALGNTVIPEGLAWGWRLISPGEPFTEGAGYDRPDVIKAIILMTDGENYIDRGGQFGTNFSAYGYGGIPVENNEFSDNPNGVLDLKTAALCNNIKADKDGDPGDDDILVYTIVFNVNSTNIQNLMRECATDPGKFFNSPTADDLIGAFQTIAAGLNQLRLAQ